jgi:hypothetical protein
MEPEIYGCVARCACRITGVIPRESGESSIPEAVVVESRGRGVLDARFRGA